jgi:hypothetical protein
MLKIIASASSVDSALFALFSMRVVLLFFILILLCLSQYVTSCARGLTPGVLRGAPVPGVIFRAGGLLPRPHT